MEVWFLAVFLVLCISPSIKRYDAIGPASVFFFLSLDAPYVLIKYLGMQVLSAFAPTNNLVVCAVPIAICVILNCVVENKNNFILHPTAAGIAVVMSKLLAAY